MSGVPGRSRRCNRNLYPIRCSKERTWISGLVFAPRIRDISQLLRSGLNLSILTPIRAA